MKYPNAKKFLLYLFITFTFFPFSVVLAELPKNTILFIGDGMGYQQVKAAGFYLNGKEGQFCFEKFPHKGQVTTHSASSQITDSAAAGTAIATGVKVKNGVISVRIPGDGSELPSLLDYFRQEGKRVGLVSTAYISHATPAAFAAHTKSRNNNKDIISDYLETRPYVLMGGAKYVSEESALAGGYTVVTDLLELITLDLTRAGRVWGQFGRNHLPYEADGLGKLPHLSDMTLSALTILNRNSNGFFLMVEGARIDHSGHGNNLKQNIFETIEFAKAVKKAVDWAGENEDTLIIVTSDHETGGMDVVRNNGKYKLPDVSWSTKGHTGVNVPLYAWGVNAEKFEGVLDNTDFFRLITSEETSQKDVSQKPAAESVGLVD